jgi:hypothetical protein
MTERACNPELGEPTFVVHFALQADHRVERQERDRRFGITQVSGGQDVRGDRVGIDLQTHCERRLRADARGDDLVHPQRVRPELFVTERVVTKDLLAVVVLRLGGGLSNDRSFFATLARSAGRDEQHR